MIKFNCEERFHTREEKTFFFGDQTITQTTEKTDRKCNKKFHWNHFLKMFSLFSDGKVYVIISDLTQRESYVILFIPS